MWHVNGKCIKTEKWKENVEKNKMQAKKSSS